MFCSFVYVYCSDLGKLWPGKILYEWYDDEYAKCLF